LLVNQSPGCKQVPCLQGRFMYCLATLGYANIKAVRERALCSQRARGQSAAPAANTAGAACASFMGTCGIPLHSGKEYWTLVQQASAASTASRAHFQRGRVLIRPPPPRHFYCPQSIQERKPVQVEGVAQFDPQRTSTSLLSAKWAWRLSLGHSRRGTTMRRSRRAGGGVEVDGS
jgi:hypothetical protein